MIPMESKHLYIDPLYRIVYKRSIYFCRRAWWWFQWNLNIYI